MHTEFTENAKVSVIIPTLNAGAAFQGLLWQLQNQSLPPHEIIVVDSESSDGTVELAQKAGAKVLRILRTEFDHGGTRNFAASQASGNIFVFMTQDVMPANDRLLQELVSPLMADEQTAYAYARQIAYPDANLIERLARENNYPLQATVKRKDDIERLGLKAFFCSNVCSAIHREVFNDMGRFPAPVIFNEDLFMAAKCMLDGGYQIAYAAEAAVYHSHNYTIKQQFKRFFDNGVSMRHNEWITKYSAVGRAGSNLVRTQLKGIASARKWGLVPRLIAESAAKLIGYKLGLNYKRLPLGLRRRFSMHKLIWTHIEASRPSSTNSNNF
ncbi:glycosyltransferase family 2 protein [Paenibacillus radicis (ex Gao et al. 2016)]|uniref:Rhamnosyltransferase n=1 Tax=Paenibacillus radicis (ex Gao et al. 2016) TaxID=1737354 RepID=A0A917H0F1_9BACL|nr:glycosyltransferase family 2 protein [Paenibacillus radicis (ex Gao et al. 2016)]GGG63392.1 rhamnosyltransferase [Paenibacillus radicis (ex Gao et al. 2016)]